MILKHFLIKIERRTLFFCLQAVNYLTSTHNEQCKTSLNLIKRQWQGPGADGKWLTQLIKHPSVRLNMCKPIPSSEKRMGSTTHFHFSISSCLWIIYCIYYVDLYLFCFSHGGIYVRPDIWLIFLPVVNPNSDKFEAARLEEIVEHSLILVVFMLKVVWFCLKKRCYMEYLWKKGNTHTIYYTSSLERIWYIKQVKA